MKEIKQAYRKLALCYHPDKDSREGNDIRFRQILEAYQTLTLQYKTELKITRKFADLYPEDAISSYEKAEVLITKQKYEEALGCYERALQINPDSDDIWNLKGICLSDLKRFEEALACFDKTTSLNPLHSAAWNFKGVCYFNLAKLEKSLECFEKTTKINPEFAVAWYNKGSVLSRLNKKKEAEKYYEKAKKLQE
jgi:tetratricopeptide (TPR) repeat protein